MADFSPLPILPCIHALEKITGDGFPLNIYAEK